MRRRRFLQAVTAAPLAALAPREVLAHDEPLLEDVSLMAHSEPVYTFSGDSLTSFRHEHAWHATLATEDATDDTGRRFRVRICTHSGATNGLNVGDRFDVVHGTPDGGYNLFDNMRLVEMVTTQRPAKVDPSHPWTPIELTFVEAPPVAQWSDVAIEWNG